MINSYKITQITAKAQIAGLHPTDENIEFIGVLETQEVLWVRNGNAHTFATLPKWAYNLCLAKYLNSPKAVQDLSALEVSPERQVELFIYHMYGSVDAIPDIKDGILQPNENFRHSKNCPSLKWDTKDITIDGTPLTERELKIIDMMLQDMPDKAIASELNITTSTFDYHKKNLFEKTNTYTKTGLIIKALNQNIA